MSLADAIFVMHRATAAALPHGDGQTPRRRVVVVFSDGHDTASQVGFDDLLNTATRSDAAIHAIRMAPKNTAGDAHGDAGFLRQLTNQTGGRAFFPRNHYALRDVYEDIRRELSQQYALGFVSTEPSTDGRFRRYPSRS